MGTVHQKLAELPTRTWIPRSLPVCLAVRLGVAPDHPTERVFGRNDHHIERVFVCQVEHMFGRGSDLR